MQKRCFYIELNSLIHPLNSKNFHSVANANDAIQTKVSELLPFVRDREAH